MVIDKIGNINNIIEPKRTKSVSSEKEIKKNDSVEISSEGKKAAESAKLAQMVKDAPDVRVERVNEIRQKIAEGTYDFNDERVLEMVADKIAGFLMKR